MKYRSFNLVQALRYCFKEIVEDSASTTGRPAPTHPPTPPTHNQTYRSILYSWQLLTLRGAVTWVLSRSYSAESDICWKWYRNPIPCCWIKCLSPEPIGGLCLVFFRTGVPWSYKFTLYSRSCQKLKHQ